MKRKIIFISIIIAFIIILSLGVVIYFLNKKEINNNEENNIVNNNVNIQKEEPSKEIEEVTNSAMYFSIKNCIDNYIKYIVEENRKAIYCILDSSYVKENNITEDNVLDYTEIESGGEKLDFKIEQMLVEDKEETIQKYYIHGILRDDEENNEEYYLIIRVDIDALVYSIIPNEGKEVFDGKK